MSVRVMIMAGGTGGHIFPALAVADRLRAEGASVSWLGSRRGMEAQLVAKADYPIDFISIAGLRGNGLLGWLVAPLRVARAVRQALSLMGQRRPDVVLGMGGFVTGPGGVAAKLKGIPLVIHEQNAIAGLTNKLLSRVADRVLAAFPGTDLGGRKVEIIGNPVRAEIAAIAPPDERLTGRGPRLRLLVVGGSLGALALNQTLPQALALLAEEERPEVHHQSGSRTLEETRRAYGEAGVEGRVMEFIDDMAAEYAWADLVLCRAGALTVSELAAAGVAAILVPYPHAVDDHQSANGRFLSEGGSATLLPQAELTPERLAGLLRDYIADARNGRTRLLAEAEGARGVARVDAAERAAAVCIEMAGEGQG